MFDVKRREFKRFSAARLLHGPMAAHAQQPERMQRIGVVKRAAK
jgi:hypothetical protein